MIETVLIAARIASLVSVQVTVEAIVIIYCLIVGFNHIKKLLSR